VVRVPPGEIVQAPGGGDAGAPRPIESFPALGTEPGDDRELIYADTSHDSQHLQESAQRVSIPRYVLYSQGFLLGVVALAFFVFGLIVGGRSGIQSAELSTHSPCTVTGSILFDDATDAALPDEGSVVILLPVARRPDEKIAADGLQPAAPAPQDDHPGVTMLRGLGGDYARVDRRGRFQVRATTTGRYFLLVISRHRQRDANEHPKANELAQLGRYVIPATQLLGQSRYQWQEVLLRADRQHNVTF
jgi:hypothetical protein